MTRTLLNSGLLSPDYAAFILRQVLGWFFVLARFRWFYDPERYPRVLNADRHKHLAWKLCDCGYGYHPALSCIVACVEVSAGVALIVGLLMNLAVLGLLGVLLFATWCTAKQKVLEQKPVDCIDCVSCYLWRVEGVYIAIAVVLLILGPGYLSLDYLVW